MEDRKLFQPLAVNGMQLKNRICMTAIQLNYCAESGGGPSEQFRRFYRERAAGGVGLITVGGCRFSPEGAVGLGFMSLERDDLMEPWAEFTDEMHRLGAKVAVQLYHAGRYSRQSRMPEGMTALAPSAVYTSYTRETAREMTREEIGAIVEREAAAARRAQKAGFDAVEILGSAGYLISQFLSPLTNLRTDEYGGSLENRFRFPREILKAVREAVGPDYPILVRMAGNDFVPGSNTNAEAVEFAGMYEACGADMLSVTGGWHETRVPQLPGEVPPGGFVYLARAIRQAVQIPVIAANRIQDPYLAEEMLSMGETDCVGMCRALLADPQWPEKVRSGREREIRHCTGCNQGCLSATFFNRPVGCLVNGVCGREDEVNLGPAEKKKRLLVVGGGPAGMEVALRAAGRGHSVTLWEKESRLGGQLALASVPPGKEGFAELIPYYETMLPKYGVTVALNRQAAPETILAGGFDEVILATGAQPRVIPVENPGEIPVVTAFDVLGHRKIPGRNVVVVGGGAIGCETAQSLARRGTISPDQLFFLTIHKAETPARLEELAAKSWRTVNLVELAPQIGSGFDAGCAWPVLKDLKRLGVGCYVNAKIVTTTADHATIAYQDQTGAVCSVNLPCDTIVLCVGSLPENTLFHELEDMGCRVHLLGDGKKTGRVMDAMRQAIDLAATL